VARTKAKNKDKTGLEIKIMLMRNGIKLSWIAVRAGVTSGAVTRALDDNDKYVGRRIRPVIAEALGVSEDEIWPSSTIPKKIAQ
jgi:lambda repressor-like predicted transcriptional regulator